MAQRVPNTLYSSYFSQQTKGGPKFSPLQNYNLNFSKYSAPWTWSLTWWKPVHLSVLHSLPSVTEEEGHHFVLIPRYTRNMNIFTDVPSPWSSEGLFSQGEKDITFCGNDVELPLVLISLRWLRGSSVLLEVCIMTSKRKIVACNGFQDPVCIEVCFIHFKTQDSHTQWLHDTLHDICVHRGSLHPLPNVR